MINNKSLTNAEKIVMLCVWEAEVPVTCKDVINRLSLSYGRNYADTTVHTFLKNIMNKGYISLISKKVNYYKANIDKETFVKEEINAMCNLLFGNDKEKMKDVISKL
ncbi:MAG: BlaI/MecI/CopY family transcriptional regulator [Lachnospiraceae bacterium]|nr:BlaI/MecI/CopY family transcriptional regulator [Lachnospiraceae bacterium]